MIISLSSAISARSAVNYRVPTFSGRWNISTSAAAFSARRFNPCS
jgi:hypothetical protein